MTSKRQMKKDLRTIELRKQDPEEAQRKRERRCFWTWPLGHVWAEPEDGAKFPNRRCRICGAIEVTGI